MTQNEAILELLADRDWHTTSAILAHVPCIVHSRIAELNDRGYTIEHRGGGAGAKNHEYRLIGTPDEAGVGTDGLSPSAPASSGASTDDPSPESARSLTAAGVPSFEQLRLVA